MIDPEERLGRLVNLRDLAVARSQTPSAQELPVNTLRNNTTGAEYSFDSAPSVAVAQGPELDYSQPIDTKNLLPLYQRSLQQDDAVARATIPVDVPKITASIASSADFRMFTAPASPMVV